MGTCPVGRLPLLVLTSGSGRKGVSIKAGATASPHGGRIIPRSSLPDRRLRGKGKMGPGTLRFDTHTRYFLTLPPYGSSINGEFVPLPLTKSRQAYQKQNHIRIRTTSAPLHKPVVGWSRREGRARIYLHLSPWPKTEGFKLTNCPLHSALRCFSDTRVSIRKGTTDSEMEVTLTNMEFSLCLKTLNNEELTTSSTQLTSEQLLSVRKCFLL